MHVEMFASNLSNQLNSTHIVNYANLHICDAKVKEKVISKCVALSQVQFE